MKKVIVVEGPAGSGKSTFVTRLERYLEKKDVKVCVVKPRMPVISEARGIPTADSLQYVVDSLLLDALRVSEVFRNSEAEVYLLDRFYLSQMVYETMRKAYAQLTRGEFSSDATLFDKVMAPSSAHSIATDSVVKASKDFFSETMTSLWHRDFRPFPRDRFHLSWVFILPSLTELTRRRTTTQGKEYPFAQTGELLLYGRVASAFVEAGEQVLVLDEADAQVLQEVPVLSNLTRSIRDASVTNFLRELDILAA